MADKGSKKKTGLTLACIILAVLVIFIIFLVKKDSIITNLKETRFFERAKTCLADRDKKAEFTSM